MPVPESPVIVAARRTPIGTAHHALASVTVEHLAAPVLAQLADHAQNLSLPITEVVMGNTMGPGGNPARVAALTAGFDDDVPALTIDRQCASGLAAIEIAAALLHTRQGAIIAGGAESASTAPWRFWPPTTSGTETPQRYERAPFAPPDRDPDMGPANDAFARARGITRERQDEYAARSHARAVAAQQAGRFDTELVPVAGVHVDERPRATLTAARLAKLRPAFDPGGTVTVGNSCGINDGAAAVLIVDAATHRAAGVPGLRILATASTGNDPRSPGHGLVGSTRAALALAGLSLDDMGVIEFNEAFAGQVLACCDELGLDPERVCREGGALALGHPWGASGAVLAVRLFHQLVDTPGRRGLAAIAAGGGQGVAMVVEAC